MTRLHPQLRQSIMSSFSVLTTLILIQQSRHLMRTSTASAEEGSLLFQLIFKALKSFPARNEIYEVNVANSVPFFEKVIGRN